MAVAAAPCEEQDGRCEDWWPSLSESTAASVAGSVGAFSTTRGTCIRIYRGQAPSRKSSAKPVHDGPNQLAGIYV
jgi:hypothetical protein